MPQSRQITPPHKAARLLRPLLGAALLAWLAHTLATRPWPAAAPLHPVGLLAALVLVPLNVWWEARKWQHLLRPLGAVSAGRALRSVLAGQAAGFFSWPVVGDYLGRSLQLPGSNRFASGGLLLYGNLWQSVATALGGALGGALLAVRLGWTTPAVATGVALAAGVAAAASVPLLPWLAGYAGKIAALRRVAGAVVALRPADRRWVAAYSLARYFLYSAQFVLLLWAYGVATPPLVTWGGAGFVFLTKALLPFAALLGGLGLREAAAVVFFGAWAVPAAPVVAAALTLWLFNVVAPVAVGSFFLSRSRWRVSA